MPFQLLPRVRWGQSLLSAGGRSVSQAFIIKGAFTPFPGFNNGGKAMLSMATRQLIPNNNEK